MNNQSKKVAFWLSLGLFLVVVPYSVVEWFDKSIPFSPSLYILCGASLVLLLINSYYMLRRN